MNEAREGNVQNTHKDQMGICKYKFEGDYNMRKARRSTSFKYTTWISVIEQ